MSSVLENPAETIHYRKATTSIGPAVDLLDQTRLPGELTRLVCETAPQLHDAIKRLVVRGAPAIGIAAAYGVTLTRIEDSMDAGAARAKYGETIDYLATSRPTAVNLFWALDRMRGLVERTSDSCIADLPGLLAQEAVAIHEEDRLMCRAIGRNGAALLADCTNVMTHCNAGALATSMWGTALAPIYQLHEDGKSLHVFADETRPLLQGARLTSWELSQAGVRVSVCTDSMSGSLMRAGQVDAVIVGADRIAGNGDVANKIGTYPLAVLAHHHKIPFYVAAPTNTFDSKLESGDLIPIEQRAREEVAQPGGPGSKPWVPEGVDVVNPAFDVTPAELVTALITEKGVVKSPCTQSVVEHLS